MPIYVLGSLLLINMTTADNTKHAVCASDIGFVGKLKDILTWWNKRNTFRPKIGYFPKAKR